MRRVAFTFANACCAHCERVVTRALERREGVASIEVDRRKLMVLVDYRPEQVNADEIRMLLAREGYPGKPIAQEEERGGGSSLTSRAA